VSVVSDLARFPVTLLDTMRQAIGLVPRVVALVDEIERIVAQIPPIIDGVREVQTRAREQVDRTAAVVTDAGGTAKQAKALLEDFEPTLRQAQPILSELVRTTSPDEVAAMVKLVDMLPEIVSKVHDDILPILDTLGTVAPDLRDLLDVSRELNEIIGSVPGLGRVKRRVEEKQAAEDSGQAHTADEQPATSPDRDGAAAKG
jgi:hypothetical protein